MKVIRTIIGLALVLPMIVECVGILAMLMIDYPASRVPLAICFIGSLMFTIGLELLNPQGTARE